MSAEPLSLQPAEPDEEEVDVDLDLISETLKREVVGKPTTVRVDGTVIHVNHAGAWSSSAMRAAATGDWDNWARQVIEDNDEFAAWVDADLENFQIEAVFQQCGRQAQMSMGKSRRHSGSRQNSRRK